jgi:hypothetical protein
LTASWRFCAHGAAVNFHRLENIVAGPPTLKQGGAHREKEDKYDDKTIEITCVARSHAAVLTLLEARRDDRLLLVLKKAGWKSVGGKIRKKSKRRRGKGKIPQWCGGRRFRRPAPQKPAFADSTFAAFRARFSFFLLASWIE